MHRSSSPETLVSSAEKIESTVWEKRFATVGAQPPEFNYSNTMLCKDYNSTPNLRLPCVFEEVNEDITEFEVVKIIRNLKNNSSKCPLAGEGGD